MLTTSIDHPAWIEIDLAQFKKNIALIRKEIGQTKLCLPVKANAYGHGLIPIAQAAVAAGVDYLAVSCLQEGARLRKADIQIPILVLGAIDADQIPELLRHHLELSIASLYKARLVAQKCKELQKKCNIHLEIDTGMQRTGVRPQTALHLFNELKNTEYLEIVGIYSHLATADEPHDSFAATQIQTFKKISNEIKNLLNKPILCHLSGSASVCNYPESLFDMVRPGLLSFGYFPNTEKKIDGIAPCLTLKAKISYFKVVPTQTGISYGHTYKTQTQSRIITIPVGYGDGFRRALSNQGSVIVHGRRYPIAGMICMDQLMVDIGHNEAHVGDEVILIGKNGSAEITLAEIAQRCDTIPYEILCGFNDRLPRIYRDNPENMD